MKMYKHLQKIIQLEKCNEFVTILLFNGFKRDSYLIPLCININTNMCLFKIKLYINYLNLIIVIS